jgi:hypothetical protein
MYLLGSSPFPFDSSSSITFLLYPNFLCFPYISSESLNLCLYGLISVFSLLFLPYIHRYQTHHCTSLEGRGTPVSYQASPQAGLTQANPDGGQWAQSQICRQARPPSRRRHPSRPSTPGTNPRPACLKRIPMIASGSSRPSWTRAFSTARRSISSAGEETGPATKSTIAAKPAGVGDQVYQSRKVVSVIRSKSEPGSEVIVTAGVEAGAIWRRDNTIIAPGAVSPGYPKERDIDDNNTCICSHNRGK